MNALKLQKLFSSYFFYCSLINRHHSSWLLVSGFCHFGLVLFMVLWQSPDTPVMSGFHVSARLRVCLSRALSRLCACVLFHVGAWCSNPVTHVFNFGFALGFGHSRSTFCLFVGVCGLEFARPHALLSLCVLLCCTQFVFLSAACIHDISCAVWHAACVFYWLRAFMLSCLVKTRGLWVFSLATCSCPVLHMAGDLFAGHVLVFLFCLSTWLLS